MGMALPQNGGQILPDSCDTGVRWLVVGKYNIHLIGLHIFNGLRRGLRRSDHPKALESVQHDDQFLAQLLIAVHQQYFHLHHRFLPRFYSVCPTALNACSSALASPS